LNNLIPVNEDLKHIFNDETFDKIWQQFLDCYQVEYNIFLKTHNFENAKLVNDEFLLLVLFKSSRERKLREEFRDSYRKDIHGFKIEMEYSPFKKDNYSHNYIVKEGDNLVLNVQRAKDDIQSYLYSLSSFVYQLEDIYFNQKITNTRRSPRSRNARGFIRNKRRPRLRSSASAFGRISSGQYPTIFGRP
jgi:hypothetical protein